MKSDMWYGLILLIFSTCTTDAISLSSKGMMRIPLTHKKVDNIEIRGTSRLNSIEKYLSKMAAITSNKVGRAGNVTLKSDGGIIYADISIGTPAQNFKVYVDTCNSLLFVPSIQCKSRACKVHNRYNSNTSSTFQKDGRPFDDDPINGTWSKDRVCMSGICAQNQSFAEVWLPPVYEDETQDGYLGLGWDSESASRSYISSLVEQGVLSEAKVSIWLNNNYMNSSIGGEIFLGGINTERFHEPLTWIPALHSSSWRFNLNNISIGSTIPTCVHGCQAGLYLNFFTSVGPKKEVDALFKVLGPNIVHETKGIFTWYTFKECNAEAIAALPEVSFNVEGKRLSLKGEDYVLLADDCLTQFLGIDDELLDIWMLGEHFMAKYYTVFDAEAQRFGFALANGYPHYFM